MSRAIIILAVMLAGCHENASTANTKSTTPAASTSAPERNLFDLPYNLFLYIDPDTGCQYLTREAGSAGMVPRIAADGKTHMGCKGASHVR